MQPRWLHLSQGGVLGGWKPPLPSSASKASLAPSTLRSFPRWAYQRAKAVRAVTSSVKATTIIDSKSYRWRDSRTRLIPLAFDRSSPLPAGAGVGATEGGFALVDSPRAKG